MPKPAQPLNATMGDIFLKELAPKESRFPSEKLRLYQSDPPAYVADVLRIKTLTDSAKEGLCSLTKPPYRVGFKSATAVGKTHAAGCSINWFYDCFDPSAVNATAPTQQHVQEVLFKEVRMQRMRAGLSMDFIGPVAPEMRTGPDHYAKGFTARIAEAFKGRHDVRMLFVIDEAVKVPAMFWDTIATMFKPELGHAWLILYNPTDTSSKAYQEEHSGEWIDSNGHVITHESVEAVWQPKWHVITISALDHPNVVTGESVIPAAVSRAQVEANMAEWCERLPADADRKVSDFEYPPGSGQWWRAGPEFDANVRARWPDQSDKSVWSDSVWEAISAPPTEVAFPFDQLPEIGGDLSSGGSNMTALHGRWGAYSLMHDEHQGWSANRKKGRIIEMCRELAEMFDRTMKAQGVDVPPLNPKRIRIKLDDAAGGWDMVSLLKDDGYNAIGINSSQVDGVDLSRYPKMRSQLWFQTARKAEHGLVKLGLLPKRKLDDLKLQAMAPSWELDGAGRRTVEEKDVTIEKLGRSPDSMDALNLSYHSSDWAPPKVIQVERAPLYPVREAGQAASRGGPFRTHRRHRGLFGQRG